MKTFLVIWFGQVVSLLGSGLTGFALGIWVYQQTGSVTRFALIAFFSSLPGLAISPFAGVLVDRWERRLTLLGSVVLSSLTTLILVLLLWDESRSLLRLWHIYVLLAVASIANSFQWLAFSSATTLLVPKKHLGRASGLTQMIFAIAQIGAPILGALLLIAIRLRGILLVDLATFAFAVLTLVGVRFREPEQEPVAAEGRPSLWSEAGYGWRYLREHPGLLGLLSLFFGSNFVTGMLQVLLTPLVLSFASTRELGTVLSLSGMGMLVGTILMSVWGGPQRRVRGIVVGLVVQSLLLFLGGLRPSLPVIGAAAFAFLFLLPIFNGCSQIIWQSKVPPGVQGKVFAMRKMVAQASLPLAYFLAGPLADHVFEPMLAPGGALASTVGAVIGVGRGRGIGLLLMVLGVLVLIWVAIAFSNPRLRHLEDELPDMT
jgi:MFS family permease